MQKDARAIKLKTDDGYRLQRNLHNFLQTSDVIAIQKLISIDFHIISYFCDVELGI
jgi:hypothetical protein